MPGPEAFTARVVRVADACGSVDPAAGERSLASFDYAKMSLQTDVETFTGLLDPAR